MTFYIPHQLFPSSQMDSKTGLIKATLLIIFAGLTSLVAAQTQGDAQKFSQTEGNPVCTFFDGFVDNFDGTVTDPRNGLIWKRCAEGSFWQGQSCSVAGVQMNWFDAMTFAKRSRYQGHSDWRLPSQAELQSIMGKHTDCKENLANKKQFAASAAIAHPTASNNAAEFFWTTTPHADHPAYAWDINLVDGINTSGFRDHFSHVRLLRADRFASAQTKSEFDAQFALLARYQQSVAEQNENNRIERLNIEAQRKTESGKDLAVRQLLTQPAQLLYVQATRAQRLGEPIKVQGVNFSPTELYELIIEHHPLSDAAVRASDRLDKFNTQGLDR